LTATSAKKVEHSRFHEPFLSRAQRSESTIEQRRALGAFLTLRLVDQLARLEESDEEKAGLRYQLHATREYVDVLPSNAIDAEHQRHIVGACDQVIDADSRRALWPPMLAFAFWLEKDLQLLEALDVLCTILQLYDGTNARDCLAATRQQARVLRLLGRFDEAHEAYDRGERLAAGTGDQHSGFVLRIGRAVLDQKRGNLPESVRQLRKVVADAEKAGDKAARAMATHDLAIALHLAERTADAVPMAFLAYELYEDRLSRQRALSDTGVLLKEMGHLDAARQALRTVLEENPSRDVRSRAVLELIEVSAHTGDRFSFERWRREAESFRDALPVDEVCNLELALGTGLAAFGSPGAGERHLENAIALAEQAGLGERLFAAEKALRELQERREFVATFPKPEQPATPELQGTIERVMALTP
jgi:tetratricopeptide (TPR) repeat protein